MQEIVKCPKCQKRIFDLEWRERTVVKIKCIHCRNIVAIEREAVPVIEQASKTRQLQGRRYSI